MKSGNPALNSTVFSEAARSIAGTGTTALMTLDGTAVKTGILGTLVVAAASYTWHLYLVSHSQDAVLPWFLGGTIAGFVVALVTIFNKQLSPITSPIYAVLEGLALGAISAIFNDQYPGIVIQAVGLTFAVLAALLFAYTTGAIKPSENYKLGVAAATGGI